MRFADYYGQLLKAAGRSVPTAQEAQRDYKSLLTTMFGII